MYSKRDHGIFICWAIGDAFNFKYHTDFDWKISQNVAVDLYRKYRGLVPRKYAWSIADIPDSDISQEYIDRYGLTCMFSPKELKEILNLDVDEKECTPVTEIDDHDFWYMFQDLHLMTDDIYKLREHILGVISDNNPDGVFKFTATHW